MSKLSTFLKLKNCERSIFALRIVSVFLRKLQKKKGLCVETKDRQKGLLHLLLAPYVADFTETEDILEMKRRSQIFSPCHIYFAIKEDFPFSNNAEKRLLSNPKNHLDSLTNSTKEWAMQNQSKTFSMHPILPVLRTFYAFQRNCQICCSKKKGGLEKKL